MAMLFVFLEVRTEFLYISYIKFVFHLQKTDRYSIKVSELITTIKFNI
jgi:hypothetical protein